VPAPSTRLRLGQMKSQSFRRQVTTPTPGPSQPCGRLPAAALHDLTSVGPSGHEHRTSDTGRRTPHRTLGRRTGHSDAAPDTRTPHRTLDTDGVDRHVSALDARTEHWMPNASRGRGQGVTTAWPVSGHVLSHRAERSRAGDACQRSTVFLLTAPVTLGSHAGSDLRPPAGARLALALRAALGRSANVRLGALLSSERLRC
jgi:hypothetical protein